MNEWIWVSLSLSAGIGLGAAFFGGLWWTVRSLPSARYPAVLLVISFLGRLAVCGLGFYLIMNGSGLRLLACLVGFLLARWVLTSRVRQGIGEKAAAGEGATQWR